jgi:hypothetical protein
MPTAKLMELLSHPIALDAFDSLSKGSHPQSVLAGIASDMAALKIRQLLGGVEKDESIRSKKDDIVDAEYTVIDVTPGVKRRTTKEK